MNQQKNFAILKEQFEQLLKAQPTTIGASTIFAFLLAHIQQGIVPTQIILTWLAVTILFNFIRILFYFYYKKHPSSNLDQTRNRLHIFRAGVMLSGVIWGCTGVLMFPENNVTHQMFVIILLTGLSAGSLISYSADFISSASYATITLVPTLTNLWFINTNETTYGIIISGILYLGFMLNTVHNVSRNQLDNISLRYDAVEREKEITSSEERYRLLLNHSPVGIAHYDTNFNITYCNQNLADILMCPLHDLLGRNLTIIKDKSILPALNDALSGKIGNYEGHYQASVSDAEGWIELTTAPARDNTGHVIGGIAIVQDTTVQKQAADEIKQLAFYDALTGLPNRRLLTDRLNHALTMSERTERRGALLFLDLDHFKILNDTLGHDMGDMLLKQVAERLKHCVRECDTVARIGGDEFVVMLEKLSENPDEANQQVEMISQKIITELNHPYLLGQYEHHSTPSVGIAMFGDHGKSHEELLKHADIAMYEAKKAGRNVIQIFDHKMRIG